MSFRYSSYFFRIADYAGQTNLERLQHTISGVLARVGLGFLPLPLPLLRFALVGAAAVARPLAKMIDVATLMLWRLGIARRYFAPQYVDLEFVSRGRTEEAIAFCRDFARAKPDAWPISVLLVDLYLATGRSDEAVRLMKSLSISCTNAVAAYAIGRRMVGFCAATDILAATASAEGQAEVRAYDRALQDAEPVHMITNRCFEKAIVGSAPSDELHRKARYWRGVLALQRGDEASAENDFSATFAGGRGFTFSYAFLADIHLRRGEQNLALQCLRDALDNGFDSLPILERMCHIQMATGDVAGALSTAGKLVQGAPSAIVADVI